MLGSKGANLCEMSRLGIPTPPGFIITTESCVEYFDQKENKAVSNQLMQEYFKGIKDLEKQTGKIFGNLNVGGVSQPLLLSVRSAAAVVMPGLTDTVLNIGINDEIVLLLARLSKNPRWAYDTYRRFIQMFGTSVLKVDQDQYESILASAREKNNLTLNSMLTTEDLQEIVEQFKQVAPIPQDPHDQLQQVISGMFCSWYSPRAVKYRTVNNIKSEFGCAIVVQSMVFGNRDLQSGSGVVFTRHPVSGSSFISGEYLPNADGEEVAAGERKTVPVGELRLEMPEVFQSLVRFNSKLEKHYRDMQEIEFTVESGELFLLESKRGKRTAGAAVQIAVSMVLENIISEREALLRIDPRQMDYFLHPVVDEENGEHGLLDLRMT
jgi:pyruvate,orthophosphate dikinase